jgi:hypothetical protein
MSRSTDPDRVFAEDPASIRLNHEKEILLARLGALIDPELSASSIPAEEPPDWPHAAVQLHEKYQTVLTELSRLNSRHMSRQLSRFLSAGGQETAMSDAMRRWWMNRY